MGGHRFRYAEQHECLIDHMRAEIVDHAGPGRLLFLPRVSFDGSSVPVIVGFIIHEPAEHTLFDDFSDGEKIAVPAAVLEDAEHPALPLRELDQLFSFADRRCERFFDDDVLAGFKTPGSQLEVRPVRRIHYDQLNFIIAKKIIEAS
jgi:hypothetical protein